MKTGDIVSRFSSAMMGGEIGKLAAAADLVIVGYSGGADSSFLLRLMVEFVHRFGLRVEAAHLNHMIRGEEADRDEKFCRDSAAAMGVPISVARVDVPAVAKLSSCGIEEAARIERYAFFDRLCSERSGRVLVATAHNADDNLETVIFNMIRGSGIRGVSGIPPVRDGRYIRPLLSFTGEEIRDSCIEMGIEYVCDSTNKNTEYTRNYIRRHLIPMLRTVNPSLEKAVLRMSEHLRADAEYLNERAFAAFKELVSEDGAADASALAELDNAMLSRVLVMMYESVLHGDFLEHTHISSAMNLLRRGGAFSLSVPRGYRFISDGVRAFFEPERSSRSIDTPLPVEYPLIPDGEAFFMYGARVSASHAKPEKNDDKIDITGNIYNLSINKAVAFDKIKGSLRLRFRKEGDAYRYGGMTRRVKKLLSEKKIPVTSRDRLPFLCDDDGIIWIPGFPLRDGMEPSDGDKIVYVSYCIIREDGQNGYRQCDREGY